MKPSGETDQPPPQTLKAEAKKLPFTFQRTFDSSNANLVVGRGDKTDEELLGAVQERAKLEYWWLTDYSKEWGMPKEQIEVSINGKQIVIYNFNSEIPFNDKYLADTITVLENYAKHFPQVIDKLNYILIDNKQAPSHYGDDEKFPLNGSTGRTTGVITLYPKGLDRRLHRVPGVDNFKGTLTHELTHLIWTEWEKEWKDHFPKYLIDPKGDQFREEVIKYQGRTFGVIYDKQTGYRIFSGQVPKYSEQYLNNYTWIQDVEDICDSMVAYIHNPKLLEDVSKTKFDLLKSKDANLATPPSATTHVVPPNEIKLPETPSRTFTYYVA